MFARVSNRPLRLGDASWSKISKVESSRVESQKSSRLKEILINAKPTARSHQRIHAETTVDIQADERQ
jgi:hypothetical protein